MKTKKKKQTTPRLGIDFGKVIMGAIINGKEDTSFLGTTFEQAMTSPATPGAVEAVTQLVDLFDGEVWIVSKCGPSVENKTRGWLKHHEFYRTTGLDPKRVRFCRQRPEKAKICRQLGITHFIDDRLDVLTPMVGIAPHLFLFGEQKSGTPIPGYVEPVTDWEQTLAAILPETVSR